MDQGQTFSDAAIDRASRALAPEPPHLKGTALAAGSRALDTDDHALGVLEPVAAVGPAANGRTR